MRSVKKFWHFLIRLLKERNFPILHMHADISASRAIAGEISVNFPLALHIFDNVLRDCIQTSQEHGGIPSRNAKDFYASVLFTALITRGVSLATLAPHSSWSEKVIEHWDYASCAILVRTMIEIRGAFHYLCIDQCSDDEWACRWNLLNLHDCNSRVRLFSESPQFDKNQVDELKNQADELRERLKSNRHFEKLPNKKSLLNGQIAYLYPIEDLVSKAGLDKPTYRYLNILFSSAVHGLPMSYYRMGEQERGRGMPSEVEEGYTAICLSLATNLLAATRDDIRELFKDVTLNGKRNPD